MQARSMCGAGPYKQFLDVGCYTLLVNGSSYMWGPIVSW